MIMVMKKIVFQQKEERDFLARKVYVNRVSDDDRLHYRESELIKLISGPRRAGKSVFALQLLEGTAFAYLNFDDEQLLRNFDEDLLMQSLYEVYGNFNFLLLDEIQNLAGWELWVNKLYRRGFNMVITGSNANMLSRELGTSLTGRYLLITLLPFGFGQFCALQEVNSNPKEVQQSPVLMGKVMASLNDYLRLGGFPEVVRNPGVAQSYLFTLFDSVLLKDVLKRYNIRNAQQLYDLAHYLLANYGNPFTFNSLKDNLQMGSIATVQKFVGYLSEPYLFCELPRYSPKVKLQQQSARKMYVIDNGFIGARSFELARNTGRLLENVVFVELLRRGYRPGLELFFYHTANRREVDFLLRDGHQVKSLVQVSYDLTAPKTRKRETDALLQASLEVHCNDLMIIAWSEEDSLAFGDKTVEVVPAWKWLGGATD